MPHIHLETSADLVENDRVPDILQALVSHLASFETIGSPAIKAYHTLRATWVMGEGAPRGFAHCTCMILTGRPPELRQQIANGMYAKLQDLFTESLQAEEASLTFELREMDSLTYRKK
jgi:5-carboxymethyl-2-hydroxymuconate isomerase